MQRPVKREVKKGKQLEFPPLAAPPVTLSADKQARLADLLRQYKADIISPEQYHAQRAKILSEP